VTFHRAFTRRSGALPERGRSSTQSRICTVPVETSWEINATCAPASRNDFFPTLLDLAPRSPPAQFRIGRNAYRRRTVDRRADASPREGRSRELKALKHLTLVQGDIFDSCRLLR